MGPFVPDPISESLNLVVALVLGLGFGFVIEQAGFSSSRRLAGVFYGYDFTVLRVFFTAAATAMSGVLLLGSFGLLDLDALYVNPTWLGPAIVGGALMGVGFLLGGYCPGTSICGAAIGKVDAMFFVAGGGLGVLGFAEAYPRLAAFNDSGSLGPLKVTGSLGIPPGVFAFLLIAGAVGAFTLTTRIERKVDPSGAPSLLFDRRRHALAGGALLVVGVVLLLLPDYRSRLLSRAQSTSYAAAHPLKAMTPDELAFRLVDREPRLKVVDIRGPSDFASFPLPGSVHVPLHDVLSKEWTATFSPRHVKKVVVGESEAAERTFALLLVQAGFENVAVLEGGYSSFEQTILAGTAPAVDGRWEEDVRRFRASARVEIRKMVDEGRSAARKAPRTEKKIQGGC